MNNLDASYWNNRYLSDDTGWDIGYASPALTGYFDQLKDKSIAILIPGGGNSYEATYLAEHGFSNVTVADISSVVCEKLKQQYAGWNGEHQPPVVWHGNFFELGTPPGPFDLVVEQTFFCALDPALREAYVKQMHHLLKPGGKLVGVLFNKEFEGGPPFGGLEVEYRQLFEPYFTIHTMSPCYNSIAPRAGNEVFIICSPKK